MKDSIKSVLFSFLFVFLFSIPATACTIFSVSYGDSVMFGANEDQRSNESFLVVDKSGTNGVVYFATPWKGIPLLMQMGINEKGLCYDMNWIPKENINPHPERKLYKVFEMKRPGKKPKKEWVITHLMKECSTVEEVLSKVFQFNFGNSVSGQFHFADKNGDAVVIHPGSDGELTFTRKNQGNGYLISTNFNLAQLYKGNWSCDRYAKADKMLSTMHVRGGLSVEFMALILNATHQNKLFSTKTLYSVVYDIQKLRIYLYFNRQFNTPHVLDLNEELVKTVDFRKVALKDL